MRHGSETWKNTIEKQTKDSGRTEAGSPLAGTRLDADLRTRLEDLQDEGREIWNRFDRDVRQDAFHPFMPADYASVLEGLLTVRHPGLRFLEWGSATGVITIMADMLGFEAYGIELDPELVAIARDLADRFQSEARFASGSFMPAGYEWSSASGDRRLGTIGEGSPGYGELGHPLDAFDLVFGYPWTGEAPIMHDLMQRCGGSGARLLLLDAAGVQVYPGGREA